MLQSPFLVGLITFPAIMVNGGPQTFPPPLLLAVFFQQGFLSQILLVSGRISWVGMLKVLSFNRSFIRVDFLLLFPFGCAWGNLFFLTGLFQCQVLVLKGWGAL